MVYRSPVLVLLLGSGLDVHDVYDLEQSFLVSAEACFREPTEHPVLSAQPVYGLLFESDPCGFAQFLAVLVEALTFHNFIDGELNFICCHVQMESLVFSETVPEVIVEIKILSSVPFPVLLFSEQYSLSPSDELIGYLMGEVRCGIGHV